MIYMVACRFIDSDDPEREARWNAYYDGEKLERLLSLPGFTGSQRFRCVHTTPAPYVALHTIAGPEVMNDQYRGVGGGGFGGWEPSIDNWSRDLFDGLEESPEVPEDGYLAITDDPATANALTGIEFAWLASAGLDRTVERRAMAVVDGADGAELAEFRPVALNLYRPITPLRRAP